MWKGVEAFRKQGQEEGTMGLTGNTVMKILCSLCSKFWIDYPVSIGEALENSEQGSNMYPFTFLERLFRSYRGR